jgi:hypothetical protein
MRHRPIATLAAVLTAALTSLAAAQQAAPDSSHLTRAIGRDQRVIGTDTLKLNRDIAMRDSARTALALEHHRTQAETARIDSLKTKLDRDRKATPRDTALVNREMATLTHDRKQLDQDLDRDRKQAAREDKIEQRVKKESDAAIDAHHDLGRDRAKSSASKPSASKSSASKTTKH